MLSDPFDSQQRQEQIRSQAFSPSEGEESIFQARYSQGCGPYFELPTRIISLNITKLSYAAETGLRTSEWTERTNGVGRIFTATTKVAICDDLSHVWIYRQACCDRFQNETTFFQDIVAKYDQDVLFVQELLHAVVTLNQKKPSQLSLKGFNCS
jgi:hypothetical protein